MPYLLPPKHRYSHEYSIYLHDIIVGMVKDGEQAGIFAARLRLPPGTHLPATTRSGEAFYSWLEENIGSTFTQELDYRLLVKSLAADFCDFVLEALRASARGKLTVSYALFRKPFKDSLLLLEWLLADKTSALTRFRTAGAAGLAAEMVSAEHRKRIIEQAAQASGGSAVPEHLYLLRYDRNAPRGMARYFDQAAHLVTSYRGMETEDHNLNFIFSGLDQVQTQWAHVYDAVPLILHHAVDVVAGLVRTLGELHTSRFELMNARRTIGFLQWAGGVGHLSPTLLGEQTILAEALLGSSTCPGCTRPFRLHKRNLRTFAVRGYLWCNKCRARTFLTG